jgi:hypothetical protein
VLRGIDCAVVRCLGRLDRVIALSSHRLGCCRMKCRVLYIHLVVISWKKFCFHGFSFFIFFESSASVDWVVVSREILFP